MSHTFHGALEGFDERQILHDGCDECEHRAKDVTIALANMDGSTFKRAWKRSFDWQGSRGGGFEATGRISECEVSLLRTIWGIQVLLEREGFVLDGDLPQREA